MKKKLVPILFVVASTILAVFCFLILPDNVITQFSSNGAGVNKMPKLGAIAIPFILVLIGALFSMTEKTNRQGKVKAMIISIAGFTVYAFLIIVNCLVF